MVKREIPINDLDEKASGNGNGHQENVGDKYRMSSNSEDFNRDGFDRDADFSVFDDGGGDNGGGNDGGGAEEPLKESGEKNGQDEVVSEGGGDRLLKLELEAKELHDRYLRALADCENVKKRAAKERSDILRYQGEQIFIDLLSVLDNFDRALESTSSSELSEESKSIREGMLLIHRLLTQVFEKWQVKGESAVGKSFDPKIHEAIGQVPSKDHEPGTVLNELERAFFYKDKLIRYGKVVVSTEG